jgi:hypothetical protein
MIKYRRQDAAVTGTLEACLHRGPNIRIQPDFLFKNLVTRFNRPPYPTAFALKFAVSARKFALRENPRFRGIHSACQSGKGIHMQEATTLKCACADCGEIIQYGPSKVGKVVKCPKCGEKSQLPPAASPAAPDDEEGSDSTAPRTCSKCGSRLGRNEVSCSECETRRAAKRASLIRTGVGLLCLAGVLAALVVVRKRAAAKRVPANLPEPPVVMTTPKVVVPKSLNDLQIGKFRLERKPDSDESRIVGDIFNVSEHSHRSVKVTLDILDEKGLKVDSLTEMTTVIPANSAWHVISTTQEPRGRAVRVSGINDEP